MNKTLLFVVLLIVVGCNTQNCSNLGSFSSYAQAISAINTSSFAFKEGVNTDKSSWIRSAKYYSCNGVDGYLVIETDKKQYIHEAVPLELWAQFKNANSFGKFYNSHFKSNYPLTIKP